MNGAVFIAAIAEDYFRDYLLVCEYLQLDPSVAYDREVVAERSEICARTFADLEPKQAKKLQKKLKWFCANYKGLVGISYGFAKRCKKLILKGRLVLHEGTVCEQYNPTTLSDKNLTYLRKASKKGELILLLATLGTLAIGTIILLLCLL